MGGGRRGWLNVRTHHPQQTNEQRNKESGNRSPGIVTGLRCGENKEATCTEEQRATEAMTRGRDDWGAAGHGNGSRVSGSRAA